MKTKFFVPMVVSMFLVLFISVGSAFAGWHEMAQVQRNQAILNKAISYDGTYQGSCKEFARKVVKEAASDYGSYVNIPSNQSPPYDYMWEINPNYSYVCGQYSSMPIEWAQPGDIVQMRIKTTSSEITPHTSIIYSINSTGIRFIDSNYCPNNCGIVKIHPETSYMSFDDFYNLLENTYTFSVYWIL